MARRETRSAPRRAGAVVAVVTGTIAIVAGVVVVLRYATARPPQSAPLPLETAFAPGIRLVDSNVVSGDGGVRTVARVLLDGAQRERADTIPGLLTTDLPTIVGDTAVLGLATDADGLPTGMFRYRIASRRYETLQLPGPLAGGASGVRVAPGGRWQVYVVFDSTGWAQGVIQRFPNGPILRRSPVVPIDWAGGRQAEAEWTDADRFALYVDGIRDGTGRWLRLRSGMDAGKWRVDTIAGG